jgi:hypothetical protein
LLEELASEPDSVYKLLAGELRGEVPTNHLPEIIGRLDQEAVRWRHGDGQDNRKNVLTIIPEVTAKAAAAGASKQMELPVE